MILELIPPNTMQLQLQKKLEKLKETLAYLKKCESSYVNYCLMYVKEKITSGSKANSRVNKSFVFV